MKGGVSALDWHIFLRKALTALAAAAGVWLFAAVILPMFAPFFIGLLAAALAERPVRALTAKRLPRRAASFLCVLAVFALAGGALFLLCRVFCREAADFLRQIPSLCQQLAPALARLQERLYALAEKLPDGIGTGLRSGIRQLFESGGTLGATPYARLFTFASGLLSRAPGLVLFVVTSVLSGFFASGELPALRAAYEKRIPAAWRAKCGALFSHLRRTLGHWLRAQLQLMGITFLVLTAGLLLLGADYPLLAAVLIAFIDALPVFGTGTVLIPWGLLCFARGEARRGVGFLVLYGAAALTRQALEPRLLGRQIGLSPLITLLALYTGFRLCGVAGMILFPIGAIFLRQVLAPPQPEG